MDDESSVVMEPMVDFWGVELSGKQKKVRWPEVDDETEPDVTVRLELRQACLGEKAKPGERNVVELTAEDENGEEVSHSILSLTVGGTEQSPLFLEVFPPVTFRLASGSGPVHIVGNIHTEFDEYMSDLEDEEELSSPEQARSRKRAADSPPSKTAKTRKLAKENGDSMDTSADHEEEDKEEEESEEEEDDSESEEEEESEVEETKKTPNKPALVSKSKSKSVERPQKSAKPRFKTPQQPPKGFKTGKVTLSAPTTPEQNKSAKKAAKVKSTMSLEDMKEKLKKTPNLPKKMDKFGNYVRHNFQVTDDKVKKQLWEFAQKVRAGK